MIKKKKEEELELFEKADELIDNEVTLASPAVEEVEGKQGFDPLHEEHGPLKRLVDFNFLQYASYVICDRAIPALEDGLKPVQRRILHALKEKDDGRFIKVANIVGHTMQYHPHGDASIADALVTLTNKRYLIEGQGNFGNIYTGDRAAASRYIECRLTNLARNELFNKELTEWIPSYDGRNKEPVSLPCKLPLMLMLGAEGIAVGLSTSILPHNFIELLEAQIEILREKMRAPAELNLLPDFQTGGLMDVSEYNKGNGKVKLRAKIEPHKNNRLVITELPHGVTTDSLMASIEDAVKKKKVPVRNIDDFTAEKVEIELTLSQGAAQEKAIQALYAFTKCETSVSSRLICLRKNRPVEVSVDEVLRENTCQLLEILESELNLRKSKLLDDFHNK
ncbi:MAG TPA: DNA gyrase subunit A, partial [Pontiella sp.]